MVKTLPSNTGGVGVIPGQGAQIPHALQPKNQNIKQKQYCNKFNRLSKWSSFLHLENLKTFKTKKS